MSSAVHRTFPHSFRALTVSGIYRRLSLAMVIPVSVAVAAGGITALIMVSATVAGAVAADHVATRISPRQGFSPVDFRAVYVGLAVAALLSVDTPPLVGAGSAAVAIIVGVWLFGGPGLYRVHPALVGPAVLGVSFSGSAIIREGGAAPAVQVSQELIARLDSLVLEPLGVRIPQEGWQLLFGAVVPDGGALVLGLVFPILLGSLILFAEDLLPAVLPGSFLFFYTLGVWLLGGLPENWGAGSPLDAVFLTQAPFVMLYLTADPGIRPATTVGMVAFGGFAGTLAAILWITGSVAVPTVVALFVSGMLVAVLDSLTTRRP